MHVPLPSKPGQAASTASLERLPALAALGAAAAGIAIDRWLSSPPWITLLLAVPAVVAGRSAMRPAPRLATACVLLVLACGGALRHHSIWTTRPPDAIASWNIADRSPIRLVGVVHSPVQIRRAEESRGRPAWRRLNRSLCVVQCQSLVGSEGETACDGLVRLTVDGELPDLAEGDIIEIVGRMRIPQPPRIPGEFDFAAMLRAQGIDRIVDSNHPEAVHRIGRSSDLAHRLGRVRNGLRRECEEILAERLSARTRPIGASLLLGTRTGLLDEVRESFIDSGAMHLLAISGLHLGILVGCIFALCGLANVTTTTTVCVAVAGLWSYSLLTDVRPPILRAAMLGSLFALSTAAARPRSSFNLLAATAFLLLLFRPCDLFDVGAQLSFLSVAAIIWSARLLQRRKARNDSILLTEEDSAWRRRARRARARLLDGYFVTGAVALFTLPVTMTAFHFVSAIGLIINVILIPFAAPLLVCGFATLACGLVWRPLAVIPGTGFEFCLQMLLHFIEWTSHARWGHWVIAAPSPWWLAAFYAVLGMAVLSQSRAARRWAWRILPLIIVLPWTPSLWPHRPGGLCCTFVDVGHGGATLIELPHGRTVLFDAGSFGDLRRAQTSIAQVLRDRGIARIDALLISHADMDHYNAAVSLMEDFEVAGLFYPRAFLDFHQSGVVELCETAAERGVPQIIVQAGDQLLADPDVSIVVLHPAGEFVHRLDNCNSLCLEVRYRGRSILLTGDIEREGLETLLSSRDAERIDVLQAPHHGAKSANSPDLARWAMPRIVVASTHDARVAPRLNLIYPDAERICTSAEAGSVVIRVEQDSELRLSATRSPAGLSESVYAAAP